MSSIEERRRRRELHHEADVVIVGAGIFGCAAAHALAEQGRSVILLERWMHEPDRIVGELLQPGGVAALRKLGLAHCLEDIDAIPCHGYNVIYHGEQNVIPYPALNERGEVEHRWGGRGVGGKKQIGRGFHHGRFVMQLRRACLAHPNITVVETEVVGTVRGGDSDRILGVETRTTITPGGEKKKDCFFGQLTVVADGYDSKFRKQVVGTKPVVKSKFYALELLDTQLPEPNHGHVVIGNAYPVLLYQIGTRETRALFDVPQGIPEASPAQGGVRGYIKNHAIPALPPSVRAAALKALEDGKIPRSMPNSWLPAVPQTPNGLILLGDAYNMRHPLTGAGMSVAFHDALTLADVLHPDRMASLEDAPAVARAVGEMYWRRKRYSSILNTLAQALYALFAADDPQLRALQMGCFEYFRREQTDGPSGMLGALIHQPLCLAYHFFYVAFVAIWMHAKGVVGGPTGVWKVPLAIVDAAMILWKACVVFLPVIWRESFR